MKLGAAKLCCPESLPIFCKSPPADLSRCLACSVVIIMRPQHQAWEAQDALVLHFF